MWTNWIINWMWKKVSLLKHLGKHIFPKDIRIHLFHSVYNFPYDLTKSTLGNMTYLDNKNIQESQRYYHVTIHFPTLLFCVYLFSSEILSIIWSSGLSPGFSGVDISVKCSVIPIVWFWCWLLPWLTHHSSFKIIKHQFLKVLSL